MEPNHPLDRPAWSALTSRLAPLTIRREQVGGVAVRLDPEVGVFVAAADGSPESRALLNARAGNIRARAWSSRRANRSRQSCRTRPSSPARRACR